MVFVEHAHDQEAALANELRRLESLHQNLLAQKLLAEDSDALPVFLTIHSGAGGTEALRLGGHALPDASGREGGQGQLY